MSQIIKNSSGGGGGDVTSVTGNNGVTASPTTGDVIVSGVNATTSTVGVASFNPADFTVDGSGEVSAIGGSSGITTIDGNTGSATGSTVTFTGINAGSSVSFSASGSTVQLNLSDVNSNTVLGNATGVTGTFNTIMGSSAAGTLSGNYNSVVGYGGLGAPTNSTLRTAAIGYGIFANLTSGNYNCGVGYTAGSAYTGSESNNILFNSPGVLGESNVLRIGSATGTGNTQLSKAFISGINGNTVSNAQMVTINSSTNQMGVQTIPSGGVTTIDGDTGSVTGSTVTITGGSTGLATTGSSTTLTLGGTLALANGGTGASLTASNGGIFYSNSSGGAILAGTATARQMLQSGASTTPVWSASTWPSSTSINQLLYSSAVNTVAGISAIANGVLISNNSSVPSMLANSGTAGFVLTANSAAPPSWKVLPSSSITINGDSGSITGSTLTIFANTTANNCGASVNFTNATATSTLNITDANSNVFLGKGAGKTGVTGANNSCQGALSLASATSADSNCGLGSTCLTTLTTGTNNCAVGVVSLQNLVSGSNCVAIGHAAGQSYTGSESNNICIGSAVTGTAAESNTTRIGTASTTSCFIGGITGATVTGTAVLCSSTGQLGTIASSQRYKENINDIDDSLSILDLNPVVFNYKTDESKTKVFGLIAEDVHEKFPDLCVYNNEGQPDAVKYHEMTALLLKEIQRLNDRILKLEMSS